MFEIPQRAEWFVYDRFGLFIHWGIYSLAARHEWVKNHERITDGDYQRYFDHFSPDLYNPDEWARMAKAAGMKYVVLTTKHHDGFCLWDSALTDYKVTNTPWGRDLIDPFVKAFRAQGLKIGFYHSLIDWHHPEFPIDSIHPQRDDAEFIAANQHRDITKYAEYLHGQTRELLTNFGRIDIMWFDFSYSKREMAVGYGKGKDDWQAEKLIEMVKSLQPDILLNDRLEIGGDIQTPEQYQPAAWPVRDGQRVLWEACQTMSGSWGYDRDNHTPGSTGWKSTEMLVKMLVDTVSKGGNLLLNVGPTGRGEFEPKVVERLDGIGQWMRQHSRAIYGCTASDFTPPRDCRYTQNGKRLYLHLFDWPYRHVHLPEMADKVEYAQLLNDASEIQMRVFEAEPGAGSGNTTVLGQSGALTLILPVEKPDVAVPVIELFLK